MHEISFGPVAHLVMMEISITFLMEFHKIDFLFYVCIESQIMAQYTHEPQYSAFY